MGSPATASNSDLTTVARIRMAALELFGQLGFDRTTVRQIAQQAEVSAGLVIHHFGSKVGLRDACDEWILDWLNDEKNLVVTGGSLDALRSYVPDHPASAPILTYIETSLRSGGPVADKLFDNLVRLSEEALRDGVKAGTMNPIGDLHDIAVVLTAFKCGLALLNGPTSRHLGGEDLLDEEVYRRYTLAGLQVFTQPLMRPDAWPLDIDAPIASM